MAAFQAPVVVFQPPDLTERRPADAGRSDAGRSDAGRSDQGRPRPEQGDAQADSPADDGEGQTGSSRRRRRGGRGRGKGGGAESGQGNAAGGNGQDGSGPAGTGQSGSGNGQATQGLAAEARGSGVATAGGGTARSAGSDQRRAGSDRDDAAGGDQADPGDGAPGGDEESGEPGTSSSSRRRRRRRQRSGSGGEQDSVPAPDDPTDTVVHVREPRPATAESDDVRAVKGSTRLEAKRQRRRESRDTGRRRPPIISESEFLARREAVERVMLVRQQGDRTQIAVLEDGILVEHYVDKASHQSYVGNVYLGKVQNVLPSMEAAFVDIGKGRNAVLYAGEVNFDATGLEGVAKRIESALKSGQSIMVQVTKDPIGHKGARLTSQISLPGRYLVYVPGASMTGISRKLPDTERSRLKQILKKVAPEEGGIIVRTAAEGASEEELQHDVTRLVAQWQAIERKAKTANAPDLLYGEPDLTIRVVRDIFNEDFTKLVIASDSEWDLVDEYVRYVAPNLSDRMERWSDEPDLFAAYRIDEQLAKALDRKVWLPSGGSLVIDTTEAMTVIDVNTGKFTGQGGNLEQTVTRNNLEAAEEIVRQLRLRDVGGIIVIDFIDMVLESNRDLVLRRLIECLARDRTKHQVAEVTSLGLVQMTRKRVGSGLLAAFSVPCEHCNGRGVLISTDLTEIPHAHGRNGQHTSTPKPGPSRSRSARTKAIAEVAARTIESHAPAEEAEAEPRAAEEPVAAGAAAKSGGGGSPRSANGGGSSSARNSSGRSRRHESSAPEPGADGSQAEGQAQADAQVRADGQAAEADGQAAAETATAPVGEPSPNGSSQSGHESGVAGDLGSADQASSGPATAVVADADQAAAAPRRRTRRSAYREAGPPDSVLASAPASQPAPAPVQASTTPAASTPVVDEGGAAPEAASLEAASAEAASAEAASAASTASVTVADEPVATESVETVATDPVEASAAEAPAAPGTLAATAAPGTLAATEVIEASEPQPEANVAEPVTEVEPVTHAEPVSEAVAEVEPVTEAASEAHAPETEPAPEQATPESAQAPSASVDLAPGTPVVEPEPSPQPQNAVEAGQASPVTPDADPADPTPSAEHPAQD
ncbi:MAG TPA: Rne/Rng family ribonuclease [Streptosporangiaceae bacterium]|nr:Rne/Rng family ribonuclease [Streptosporangiaceae bacterium]